jgi:hypothetical protein
MYNTFPGFVAGIASTTRGILQCFEYNLFNNGPGCMSSFEETVKQGFRITMPMGASRYPKNFYFNKNLIEKGAF